MMDEPNLVEVTLKVLISTNREPVEFLPEESDALQRELVNTLNTANDEGAVHVGGQLFFRSKFSWSILAIRPAGTAVLKSVTP